MISTTNECLCSTVEHILMDTKQSSATLLSGLLRLLINRARKNCVVIVYIRILQGDFTDKIRSRMNAFFKGVMYL